MYKVPVILFQILLKCEFGRLIFEKCSNIKFLENSYSGSRAFHADGRTDKPTDFMRPIVAFRNFANPSNDDCLQKLLNSAMALSG